jgi:hypothetical protein
VQTPTKVINGMMNFDMRCGKAHNKKDSSVTKDGELLRMSIACPIPPGRTV